MSSQLSWVLLVYWNTKSFFYFVRELLARIASPLKYIQIGKGIPSTMARPASNYMKRTNGKSKKIIDQKAHRVSAPETHSFIHL